MKFRWKLTLSMLCLLGALFGIGGSMLISVSFYSALERELSDAQSAYQMVFGTLQIVEGVQGVLKDWDIAGTLEQLSGQNAGAWSALRLSAGAGELYGENTSALLVMGQPPPGPGTCRARCGLTGRGEHVLSLAGALDAGGETLYLEMSRDISALYESREEQERAYQGVFSLMCALCALLSYGIARLLTRPLGRLSRASRAIAAGELSARAPARTRDEIGLLAEDFNRMAARLEENIGELKASVERRERFLGAFAHELKTPMTSIIGYADLLRAGRLSPEEQSQAAHYIFSEGKRLENLSRKLLELLVVKREPPALVPAAPAALVGGLAAHLGPLFAGDGIVLTVECEEGICRLEPDLVKSLLANLLDNARKAMAGRGGSILIRSEMLPDGCRLTVQDNGPGIPPEALAHLTEEFYRVDKARSRQQGGAGLGLALCDEIVKVHHGSLTFESGPEGTGLTVTAALRGGAA